MPKKRKKRKIKSSKFGRYTRLKVLHSISHLRTNCGRAHKFHLCFLFSTPKRINTPKSYIVALDIIHCMQKVNVSNRNAVEDATTTPSVLDFGSIYLSNSAHTEISMRDSTSSQ